MVTSAGTAVENELLANLNPEQKQAVTLQWGPALILAGAGSGKTTVLTRRIAYLIKELRQDPESILAVTFTNKAAGEMKERIEKLLGADVARRAMIGTFHSICARMLRKEIEEYKSPEGWKWSNNFVIYDETDSLSILKNQLKKMNLDEKVFAPRDVKNQISALKNDGFTSAHVTKEARTYRENRIAEVFASYQSDLARNNALDFDDLILIFSDLLNKNDGVRNRLRNRFRNVLVDEFQDTNRSQYDLVKLIGTPIPPDTLGTTTIGPELDEVWRERTLLVVGDVDQSIYSWRKADFRIILGFQADYKNTQLIKLEENYRSTSNILEVANSIIVNNTERIDKVLRCNRGTGAKAQCYEASDEIDEAFYVVEELKRIQARGKKLSECVILYRTNAQSRAIEEVLVRHHMPYTMVGGTKFYDRQEIKDCIAYLKLVYNPQDGQAFNRVINVPRRGIGKTSLDHVINFAEMHKISMVEAAQSAEQIEDISVKTGRAIKEFAMSVSRWRAFSLEKREAPVSSLLEMILREIHYISKLEEDAASQKDELAEGRIENIRELINVAAEFEETADEPDLDSFLTRISLVSDLDKVKDTTETVKLMTLHSAKGLEFPIVFLMGLEEGLFPHMRSLDSTTAMEEERRLMYVGVTRAEDLLYLTLARKRMMIGHGAAGGGFGTMGTIPSRFLKEITPGLVAGYYPNPDTPELGATGGGGNSSGGSGFNKQAPTVNKYGAPIQPEFEREPEQQVYDDDAVDRWGRPMNKPAARSYDGGGSKYGGNSYGGSGSGYGGNSSSYGGSSNRSGSSGSGGSQYGGNRAASSGSSSPYGSKPVPAKPRAQRMGEVPGSGSKVQKFTDRQAIQSNVEANEPVKFEHLVVGDQVTHVKFGNGTVTKVIGEGDKELYNIEFAGGNSRLLDPRFAKLIKLN